MSTLQPECGYFWILGLVVSLRSIMERGLPHPEGIPDLPILTC